MVVIAQCRRHRIVALPGKMQHKSALLVDVETFISLFGFASDDRPDGLRAQVDRF